MKKLIHLVLILVVLLIFSVNFGCKEAKNDTELNPLKIADACNPIRKYYINPANRPVGTNGNEFNV